jgi:hypothetical protein
MQSFGLEAIAERRRPMILKRWDAFTNFLEENRQHIFYIFMFYVITLALFIERFICKSFLLTALGLGITLSHFHSYYLIKVVKSCKCKHDD